MYVIPPDLVFSSDRDTPFAILVLSLSMQKIYQHLNIRKMTYFFCFSVHFWTSFIRIRTEFYSMAPSLVLEHWPKYYIHVNSGFVHASFALDSMDSRGIDDIIGRCLFGVYTSTIIFPHIL